MTITPNANWAVVGSVGTPILARINLVTDPPVVAGIQTLESAVNDIDITPNGIFAVAAAAVNRLYSYLIDNDQIGDNLLEGTVAVSVSPNGNGLILASSRDSNGISNRFEWKSICIGNSSCYF